MYIMLHSLAAPLIAQALLAGGSHAGDVLLWDLAAEDDGRGSAAAAQCARTGAACVLRHLAPVTALSWQHSASEAASCGTHSPGAYQLFSLGADGRLLVWRCSDKLVAPMYGWVRADCCR